MVYLWAHTISFLEFLDAGLKAHDQRLGTLNDLIKVGRLRKTLQEAKASRGFWFRT